MAIKTIPEDFIVDERIDPRWLQAVGASFAPFAVYRLDKRDITTPDACDAVARALHVAPKMVNAAGLKDRQAVTSQLITVGPLRPNSAMPRHLETDHWKIHRLGFRGDAISAAAIAGNHFTLVLRTLTQRDLADMDAAVERLTTGGNLRFVNYFGSQRFGSARHGEGFAAFHLCKGEFDEAVRLLIAAPHKRDTRQSKLFKRIVRDRWPPGSIERTGSTGNWRDMLSVLPQVPERRVIEYLASHPDDFRGAFRVLPYFTQQMCVEAYQSWLWNRIARQLILQWCPADATFTVPDLFNDLTFACPAKLDHRLVEMNLPVLGRDSELAGPWVPAAEKVLAEEGLTTAELTIPGVDQPAFNQVNRMLIVDATELRLDDPVPDELQPKAKRYKRTIQFTLPRGSYATVALRAIGN